MVKINNINKLKTKEDFLDIHKLLGIYSILHYGYRSFNRSSDIHYLFILPHLLLSLSSLIFKIVKKKHKNIPVIWPEFRLHSILFASRSFIACFLVDLCKYYNIEEYGFLLRFLLVFSTLYLSNVVTYHYKKVNLLKENDSTMRTMPYFTKKTKLIKKFYSIKQFIATSAILFNTDKFILFYSAFPVQIAAFLMTCVKKNIITNKEWHIYYSFSLLITLILSCKNLLEYLINFIYGIILLKIRIHINKYLLWSTVFVIGNTIMYLNN